MKSRGPGRTDRRPGNPIDHKGYAHPTPAQDRVLRLLHRRCHDPFGPSWTRTRYVGGGTNTAHRDHLLALVRRGLVERRNLGTRGAERPSWYYRVTPAGEAYLASTGPLDALRRQRQKQPTGTSPRCEVPSDRR